MYVCQMLVSLREDGVRSLNLVLYNFMSYIFVQPITRLSNKTNLHQRTSTLYLILIKCLSTSFRGLGPSYSKRLYTTP